MEQINHGINEYKSTRYYYKSCLMKNARNLVAELQGLVSFGRTINRMIIGSDVYNIEVNEAILNNLLTENQNMLKCWI